MYGWIVRKMIEGALRSQAEGDLGPLLSKAADDVHFTFPGESSWSADIHGKANLEPWITRFMEAGLQFEPQEIVVNGWPWDTSFYIYFTDHGKDDDGAIFYQNEGVIRGKIAWGKIRSYTVFEDTQKVAALDEYQAAQSR
jgi:ketosteroid isomerase-like protein